MDVNLKWAAQIKLKSLTQGTDTAEDFFQKFKLLLIQAGYAKDNEYIVTLLEKNVNERIIDQIYTGTDLPMDYETWKYAVMKLNAMWRHRNQHKRWGGYTPRIQNQQQLAPLPARQTHTSDQRDGTGITFGGARKAMEIDKACHKGLCFHCGTAGHIAQDCPKKDQKFQVRKLTQELTDAEWDQLIKERAAKGKTESTSMQDFPTPQQ